jgi:hypothetical protein
MIVRIMMNHAFSWKAQKCAGLKLMKYYKPIQVTFVFRESPHGASNSHDGDTPLVPTAPTFGYPLSDLLLFDRGALRVHFIHSPPRLTTSLFNVAIH